MQDIAEHLTTIYLKRCDRGKRCLYEGSTPADGFPNTWVCPPFHSSLPHINIALHSLKVTNLVISFLSMFFIYCRMEHHIVPLNLQYWKTAKYTRPTEAMITREIKWVSAILFLWNYLFDIYNTFVSPGSPLSFHFQVWGVKGGPYEFKPAPASSFSDPFSSLTIPPQFTEKRIEGSFVLQNWHLLS